MNHKGDCEECADGAINHCPRVVNTFDGKFENGGKSYGGYADYNRAKGDLVIQIPEEISSADAGKFSSVLRSCVNVLC